MQNVGTGYSIGSESLIADMLGLITLGGFYPGMVVHRLLSLVDQRLGELFGMLPCAGIDDAELFGFSHAIEQVVLFVGLCLDVFDP